MKQAGVIGRMKNAVQRHRQPDLLGQQMQETLDRLEAIAQVGKLCKC